MDRQEIVSFNVIRGIAALAVCVSHLRAFLLVQFPTVVGATGGDRLFYFVTGLGHQSVVVFFVMSGWLVGNSVWQQQEAGQFSWRGYAIARLSRLLIVLIPALAFTFAIDSLGVWVSGGDGYDGSQHAALLSVPGRDTPLSLSPFTLLGNVLFLQTILVPVLGSNGPLWSLANEFWYYVLFPLIGFAWHFRKSRRAIAFAMAAIAIFTFLPTTICASFTIWLFGWIGSMFVTRVTAATARPLCAVSLVLLFGSLAASKMNQTIILDVVIGIAVTLLLLGLKSLPKREKRIPWMGSISSGLANISFTLYLFHFPLLTFLFFSSHMRPKQPSMLTYGEFALLLGLVLLFAACVWFLFERQTDDFRRYLSRIVLSKAATTQSVALNAPSAFIGNDKS